MSVTELQLEQGSQEWLDFRRQYRMASETPAIMGLSTYSSPADVRNAKMGKGAFVNNAMRQGTAQEPVARAAYEAKFNETMQPGVFLDGLYGCSLDGRNLDGDTILEVKVPYKDAKNSERWKLAEEGKVSPSDYAQIQHQLMVFPAAGAHLWVWDAEAQEGIHVAVEPNPVYWDTIRAAWDAFWLTLEERTDDEWSEKALAYRIAKQAADDAAERLEAAKADLLKLRIGDFQRGAGIEVKKIVRTGTVDWKAVEKKHLAGVDLEAFRKKPTEYFDVKVVS